VLAQTITAEADANAVPVDIAHVAMKLNPNDTRAGALTKLFQVCVLNGTDAPAGADIKKRVREDWTLYIETAPDSKRLLPLRLRLIFNSLTYMRRRIQGMQSASNFKLATTCTTHEYAELHSDLLAPPTRMHAHSFVRRNGPCVADVLDQIEMVIGMITSAGSTPVGDVSIVTPKNRAVFPDPRSEKLSLCAPLRCAHSTMH
jgi:hypothetical protein